MLSNALKTEIRNCAENGCTHSLLVIERVGLPKFCQLAKSSGASLMEVLSAVDQLVEEQKNGK